MFVAAVVVLTTTMFAQAVTTVNSGSFTPQNQVAPNSIASIFGGNLSVTTAQASTLPLPTTLSGVTVTVGGLNGALAPLFFISPNQINFLVPGFVGAGNQEIIVRRDGHITHIGTVNVVPILAGFFNQSTSSNNYRVNSGYVTDYFTGGSSDTKFWEFSASGLPVIKPVPQFVSGHNYYGVFYLTGAAASNTNFKFFQVKNVATGDRITLNASYSGPSFQFAGLDQFNVKLNDNNGYLLPSGTYQCWAEWTNNGTLVFTSTNVFYIQIP